MVSGSFWIPLSALKLRESNKKILSLCLHGNLIIANGQKDPLFREERPPEAKIIIIVVNEHHILMIKLIYIRADFLV